MMTFFNTATTRAGCSTLGSVHELPVRLPLSGTIDPTTGFAGMLAGWITRARVVIPPMSLRSRMWNAISTLSLSRSALSAARREPRVGLLRADVTAMVPTDVSWRVVVDVGTFELLNGISTYSDAVPSPPTQSDAIWAGMSLRISPTDSLSAEAGVHATVGVDTTKLGTSSQASAAAHTSADDNRINGFRMAPGGRKPSDRDSPTRRPLGGFESSSHIGGS